MSEKDANALLDPVLLTEREKSAEIFAAWKKGKGFI
jgi:hypothetical protein